MRSLREFSFVFIEGGMYVNQTHNTHVLTHSNDMNPLHLTQCVLRGVINHSMSSRTIAHLSFKCFVVDN